MGNESVIEIKKLLVMMAAYYDKRLTDLQIQMYASDLKRFTFEELMQAWGQWKLKSAFFPLPGQLTAQMSHELNPTALASKVWKAISQYGVSRQKEAKAYLGEAVWRRLEQAGGWEDLCSVQISQRASFIAQMRDLLDGVTHERKNELEDTRDREQPILPDSKDK